jgi:flavin reductase (DIM6/NTAB) family NADH-FMN oxidoreductase RutF
MSALPYQSVDPRIDAGPQLDPDQFKAALRRHPAGVAVITCDGGRGPAGFTATSLISLSLQPPLVAFALSHTASTWPSLRDSDTVVVHLLGEHQQEVAQTFATSGIDRFAEPTRWCRLATGEPLIAGTPTWIRCDVEHRIAVGDHDLVVGRALQVGQQDVGAPLLYHDRAYKQVRHHSEP